MSEVKSKGLSTLLVVAAVIIALIIGVVAGYFVKPTAPAEVKTETKTVEKTVTVEVTPTKAPKYTFYFVSHGALKEPYWISVKKGIDLASSILNIKTVYLAPEEFNIKQEVEMLESAIEAKPDALIVAITSSVAMDEPLRKAIKQGIPVLAFDTDDDRSYAERVPRLGYVGMADYLCGKYMALRSLKEITPRRILVTEHEPGATYSTERVRGILDACKEMGIDVPVDRLDITMDPAKMTEIVRSYLISHPDCDLILSLGAVTIHPILSTLRDMGLAGKVLFSSVNIIDEAVDAIKKGEMICAVGEQPFAVGFVPVVWMYLHLEIGYVPPDVMPTGPAIIDKDTLNIALKQIEEAGAM